MKSLGDKVLSSSLWSLLGSWIGRLIGLVSMMILARLLVPDDYGLVAIAQIVVMLFQIVLADGTESYLIRKTDITQDDYNTAWTIRLIIAIFISYCVFFGRFILSELLNEPRLVDILVVLSVSNLFFGFTNIGVIKLKKSLNYKPIFKLQVVQKIAGFITSITIAFQYGNYWALILGIVAVSLSEVAMSYVISNYRPKMTLINFKQQWFFTKWIFVGNFASFFRNKFTQLLISKQMGAMELGKFSMAFQLTEMISTQLINPILAPVYASYASVRDNDKELAILFIKVCGVVSIIVLPLFSGLFILSEQVISVLLGSKWMGIVNIFELVIFFVMAQTFIGLPNTLLTLLGKVKLLAIINWVMIIILIPSIVYVVYHQDLYHVVLTRTLIAVSFIFIFYLFLFKYLAVDKLLLFSAIARPIISSGIMCCYVFGLKNFYEDSLPILFFEVFMGALVYILILLILWQVTGRKNGGEEFVLSKFSSFLGNVK